MAKRELKLSIRIPPYPPPRNSRRRELYDLLSPEAASTAISYVSSDKLQLKMKIYLLVTDLSSQDADNRLKDMMDALQGEQVVQRRYFLPAPLFPTKYSNA